MVCCGVLSYAVLYRAKANSWGRLLSHKLAKKRVYVPRRNKLKLQKSQIEVLWCAQPLSLNASFCSMMPEDNNRHEVHFCRTHISHVFVGAKRLSPAPFQKILFTTRNITQDVETTHVVHITWTITIRDNRQHDTFFGDLFGICAQYIA